MLSGLNLKVFKETLTVFTVCFPLFSCDVSFEPVDTAGSFSLKKDSLSPADCDNHSCRSA